MQLENKEEVKTKWDMMRVLSDISSTLVILSLKPTNFMFMFPGSHIILSYKHCLVIITIKKKVD